MVHCLHALDSLLFKPVANLKRCDNRRARPLRDLNQISDMIAMTMRHQDKIGSDLSCIDLLRQWIGSDEGIEKQRFSTGDDSETGVSVIDEFHNDYLPTGDHRRNWPRQGGPALVRATFASSTAENGAEAVNT